MSNKPKRLLPLLAALAFSIPTPALVNGGFDEGTVPSDGAPAFPDQALPGWSPFSGRWAIAPIGYNTIPIGGADVSIHDQNTFDPIFRPIFGPFGVSIHGGYDPEAQRVAGSISQTTSIPTDMRSLLFAGRSITDRFSLSFAGQNLPYYEVARYDGYSAYGADITSLRGASGTLSFSSAFGSRAFIDSVRFSTFIVPEPSTASLAAAGLLFLVFAKRRSFADPFVKR